MKKLALLTLALVVNACGNTYVRLPGAHAPSDFANRSAEADLRLIHKDIKRLYFDSTFNGVDLEAQFEQARERIRSAHAVADMHAVLQAYLASLGDSHTYFVPPGSLDTFDYGFDLKMFGELCLVSDVEADSHAAQVGLKRGDQVLMLDGQRLDRSTFDRVMYDYYILRPRAQITLIVQDANAIRQLTVQTRIERAPKTFMLQSTGMHPWVAAKLKKDQDSLRAHYAHRFTALGKVAVWKMPTFAYKDGNISKVIDQATDFETLILDLRGNGGGAVQGLQSLTSRLFDRPIHIGLMRERRKTEPLRAEPARRVFGGRLMVLVDSETGSAAEVLARLIQLEKRGTVIGDRTAGAVRTSSFHAYRGFTLSITASDLIMGDGQSLEHVGVVPNEWVIMQPYHLAEDSDPILAHALGLAGVQMDALAAARINRPQPARQR